MAHIKHGVSLVVFALFGGACYQGVDGDLVDEIAEMRDIENNAIKWNAIKWNDIKWNGIKWNDIKWNAVSLNDIKWNGIKYNGIKYNGIKYNDTRFDGSTLVISRKVNGKWVEKRGEDLVGMEMNLTVDVVDGKGKKSTADFILRADDIYANPNYDDVLYYDLVISKAGTNQWQPLCDGGGPVIPIPNYWNETNGDRIDAKNVVTFACTNGVLAHCVEWGYRPWAEAEQCYTFKYGKKTKKFCWDISLKDHHQACTRMARADYCGDGKAWTVPGTPIDIFDGLDPKIETSETDWDIEAEWNPNGAYCLNDIRQQGWKAMGKYPKCKWPRARELPDCGSLKDHRALLGSKFEPVD